MAASSSRILASGIPVTHCRKQDHERDVTRQEVDLYPERGPHDQGPSLDLGFRDPERLLDSNE